MSYTVIQNGRRATTEEDQEWKTCTISKPKGSLLSLPGVFSIDGANVHIVDDKCILTFLYCTVLYCTL